MDEIQGEGKQLLKYPQCLHSSDIPARGGGDGGALEVTLVGGSEGTAANKSADSKFHLNTGCISLQIVLGRLPGLPCLGSPLCGWSRTAFNCSGFPCAHPLSS